MWCFGKWGVKSVCAWQKREERNANGRGVAREWTCTGVEAWLSVASGETSRMKGHGFMQEGGEEGMYMALVQVEQS